MAYQEILIDDTPEFEVGRLDRAGDPGYIVMFTCESSQRQEYYTHDHKLISARNRIRHGNTWGEWVDEKGESDDRGRSIVAGIVCLRKRRSSSSYW